MTLTCNLSPTRRGAGGSRGAYGDPRITRKTYGWAFQRGRFQCNMRKNFQLLEKPPDGFLVVQSCVPGVMQARAGKSYRKYGEKNPDT